MRKKSVNLGINLSNKLEILEQKLQQKSKVLRNSSDNGNNKKKKNSKAMQITWNKNLKKC